MPWFNLTATLYKIQFILFRNVILQDPVVPPSFSKPLRLELTCSGAFYPLVRGFPSILPRIWNAEERFPSHTVQCLFYIRKVMLCSCTYELNIEIRGKSNINKCTPQYFLKSYIITPCSQLFITLTHHCCVHFSIVLLNVYTLMAPQTLSHQGSNQ